MMLKVFPSLNLVSYYLTYFFVDDKTYYSRKAKDQARVLRAEVSIDKIQFYYILHNQNKLIRKFGGDCVMRVKFSKVNNLLRGRAEKQALLVFQRGIEVAGRLYQYVASPSLPNSYLYSLFTGTYLRLAHAAKVE